MADVIFTKIYVAFLGEVFELRFKEHTEWAPVSIEHDDDLASSIKLTIHEITGSKPNQHNPITYVMQPKNLLFQTLLNSAIIRL